MIFNFVVCNDVKTMKFIKVEVSDDIYFDDDEFQSTDADDESNDEIDSKPIICNKKKISHATPSFVQSEDSSILRCGDTVRIMSTGKLSYFIKKKCLLLLLLILLLLLQYNNI